MRKILSLAFAVFLQSLLLQSSLRAQITVDTREMAVRKLLQSTIMINQMYVDTVNIDRHVI